MRKKILLNSSLLIGGLGVALLMVELFLRAYNPFPFQHSFGSLELPVNRLYHYTHMGRRYTRRVNSIGLQGDDPPTNFENALSLVVVGGSTTECRNMEESESWPEIMKQQLAGVYPEVWLNIAGFSGHSTRMHLKLVEQHLLQLRPSIVLFLIGANDVGQKGMEPPSFDLPVLGVRDVLRNSHLVQTGFNFYRLYRVMPLPWSLQLNLHALEPFEISEKYKREVLQEHREKYLPDYRARLEKLLHLLSDAGIEAVLITQPLLYGPGVDPATGLRIDTVKLAGRTLDATSRFSFPRPINGLVYWETLQLYNGVTKELGNQSGKLVIDLASKMPKSTEYFVDSMHFTVPGAEKVGEIVAGDLLEHLQES